MKQFILLTTFILFTISTFSQTENLKILWPEEYKWKIRINQEDETSHFIEVIPEKEEINSWTILGAMNTVKNTIKTTTDQVIKSMTESSLSESPKAKLTVLEKNDSTKNNWIIFKIETPSFPNDPIPESQLFYVIQGKQSLFMNFVAIKVERLSNDFITKWTKVFKSSELIYQKND